MNITLIDNHNVTIQNYNTIHCIFEILYFKILKLYSINTQISGTSIYKQDKSNIYILIFHVKKFVNDPSKTQAGTSGIRFTIHDCLQVVSRT